MSPRPTQPGQTQRMQRERQLAAWDTERLDRGLVQDTPPADPLIWTEFAVQSVADNHLVCLAWDGVATHGTSVNVAKDPELRKSHYHGLEIDGLEYDYTGVQARTVTKTSDESTRDQVIIPKYHVPADGPEGFPGSIITAAPIATLVVSGAGTLHCQWREVTQRAYANVEAAE